MDVNYIIVQAGGKGTRMKQLTYNKPKALVPIDNLPMLFHLFRQFPEKQFLIIGDYKYEVLEKYLHTFAEVNYALIDARGMNGTCAGLKTALEKIPEQEAVMLIWSDLILSKEYEFPEEQGNYVGISKSFSCRWRFKDGVFEEVASDEYGVAGHFIFENRKVVFDVPEQGEFVRWLKEKEIMFRPQLLDKTKEYGLLGEYNKLERKKCRPFNRITVDGKFVIKEPLDMQGKELAVWETAWYKKVKKQNFTNVPKIYETMPLKMEKIDGKNIYECVLGREEKKDILKQLVDCICTIHKLESCPANEESYYEAYIGKTFRRLQKVYGLIPFAKEKTLRINGKDCPNIFYQREKIERLVKQYMPKQFQILHGDCTFSNILLKHGNIPFVIDPRGYFGFTQYYGDAAYDWVKLYYSIVGNYDQFNLKRFVLKIEENEVFLTIESNGWEDLEEEFFILLKDEVNKKQMQLLHALTWLSLTTYAWEDYDSVCGAFYKGNLLLRDVLE